MSRRQIQSVADDFARVWEYLQDKGIVPRHPGTEMIGIARRMHRATHSLILWRFRLRPIPEHGMVFVDEIASDALQILPQALMGYGKTTKLLIRGVIENTLRHLYFSDHPVEFARMNRERKWYLSVEDLFSYPQCHGVFLAAGKRFDAVQKLKSLYSELSAGIHGRRVQDLEMRVALEKIVFSKKDFELHANTVERCAEAVNFLLAAYHDEKVSLFTREDRQIILRTMQPGARKVLKNLPELLES